MYLTIISSLNYRLSDSSQVELLLRDSVSPSYAHSSVKCNTVTNCREKLHREFYSLVFRACPLYVAVVFGRTHCFMPHRYTHSVQRYLFCRTSKDLLDELAISLGVLLSSHLPLFPYYFLLYLRVKSGELLLYIFAV